MNTKHIMAAALVASGMAFSSPVAARSVDEQLGAVLATCSTTPLQCAAALSAFNAAVEGSGASLTGAQLSQISAAVQAAGGSLNAGQRSALASALDGSIVISGAASADVVAAASAIAGGLSGQFDQPGFEPIQEGNEEPVRRSPT